MLGCTGIHPRCFKSIYDESLPDYDNLIKLGTAITLMNARRILLNSSNDVHDMEKRVNWEAMIIVMEAIINFSYRYADLAEKQAAECG